MRVETLVEQLFFTTVRIDTVDGLGNVGAGTGFLYAHKQSDTLHALFVVTNKHVVNGKASGSLTFHTKVDEQLALGRGYRVTLEDWPLVWFGHPDPEIDIAVAPLVALQQYIKDQSGVDLFYRLVDSTMLATTEQTEQLDAIEDVTFIGYPNGIWDTKNLLPVARRGTTATPLTVDFEGTPRFLIDASVFGGSSGSPVFIVNQGLLTDRLGNISNGTRLIFVGVVAAVYYRTSANEVMEVPIPTQVRPMVQQHEMIDLGIVFKARTVVETIDAFISLRGISEARVQSKDSPL